MKKLIVPTALALMLTLVISVFPAYAAGGAPIAENLELDTYRGISVGGRLSATDPEGGELKYRITTAPIKGSIDLDDSGHFVYTPEAGKRGKDYFGYKATDCDGNDSQEATVIIRIQKQKSKISYTDLNGKGCADAAVKLAEENIFIGECLAGEYVFSPDAPVTRAEFLTICMKISGTEAPENIRTTGFTDDAEIAAWAKPYVCKALKQGVISGYDLDGTGAVFAPDRGISVTEAAVILDRSIELTDAVAAWFSADESVPAWASQSAANVSSCGLLPVGCSFGSDVLTRGQAAEMLCSAMELISSR